MGTSVSPWVQAAVGAGVPAPALTSVGRCTLTVSSPVLKVPTVSALETRLWHTAFKLCFQIHFAPLHLGAAVLRRHAPRARPGQHYPGRGLNSSPVRLNLSTFLWDKLSSCVASVMKTAQVELNSGRV